MIRVFFGSPGCGKTTLAVKLLKKSPKLYKQSYCNFSVNGLKCPVFELPSHALKTIGEWTLPPNSYLSVDEAGIEYNNRKFKTLSQTVIEWFKLHRHYGVDVDIFSQSWDDMDITLRRLAEQLWYLRRIGPFTIARRVYKRVTVNQETEQIIDGYRMERGLWLVLQPLRLLGLGFIFPQLKGWKLTFRPLYYKYFNSWETPDTPVKYSPLTYPY